MLGKMETKKIGRLEKYSHLPTVPRYCLLALERFNYDAKKAAEYLGIPARSVVMYAEQGRASLEESAVADR